MGLDYLVSIMNRCGLSMTKIQTIALIENIFKCGKDFYVRLVYDSHTATNCKITLKEAEQLEVGQRIKYFYWWKENGHGQDGEIPRPIQILENQEQKYRGL
jgi:hypothetical protein